ncbi:MULTISPECIES: ferritin-like domain-containing protein [Actinomadura]|uniref:ferritin-like domain-containing protein n=1 Tax=Actinomadura TaxID=1988 RepID=UPI0003FC77BD|nr:MULTISPECIES: ferritin-like domain-containing protein [Actinomadura]
MPQAVPRGGVRRRALLGGALALPLLSGALTGCAAEAAAPVRGMPALVRAIAAEQDLIATYEAARAAVPGLAGEIDPVLARHREHLRVLKAHHVPGSGDRRHEGGRIPPPGARPVPSGRDAALAALRRAEGESAAARAADTADAEPGLAQLLASIAACEAGHARTAGGDPAPVPGRSGAPALQDVLAAEHAAVYGYGVLGGRLAGELRATAKEMWDGHRSRRDALLSVMTADPVAAAPAYELPVRITDVRSAALLAAALEDGVVPGYVALAGASAPDLRVFAADGALRAAARAARWRARAGAAAPADAFPGLPDAALAPRPVPGDR